MLTLWHVHLPYAQAEQAPGTREGFWFGKDAQVVAVGRYSVDTYKQDKCWEEALVTNSIHCNCSIKVMTKRHCFSWQAPPTGLACISVLVGLGLLQEGSRAVDMLKVHKGNPTHMTGFVVPLSPTKCLSFHLESWLSLVMLVIFKTKVVKYRFQY